MHIYCGLLAHSAVQLYDAAM